MPKVGSNTVKQQTIPQSVRLEQLAINLFDIDRLDEAMRVDLLKGKLILVKDQVIVLKGEQETGVPFCCDLLTAASVCDLIRNIDREQDQSITRVYIREPGRPWVKMPNHAVLCSFDNDRCSLSPLWFPDFSNVIAPDDEAEAIF